MPRKKKEAQEQLDLIDVAPENAKEIVKVAKKYKEAMTNRVAWLEKEKAFKAQILELVHKAKLTPVDGKIKFTVDGLTITVTPRDELVQVKEVSGD